MAGIEPRSDKEPTTDREKERDRDTLRSNAVLNVSAVLFSSIIAVLIGGQTSKDQGLLEDRRFFQDQRATASAKFLTDTTRVLEKCDNFASVVGSASATPEQSSTKIEEFVNLLFTIDADVSTIQVIGSARASNAASDANLKLTRACNTLIKASNKSNASPQGNLDPLVAKYRQQRSSASSAIADFTQKAKSDVGNIY